MWNPDRKDAAARVAESHRRASRKWNAAHKHEIREQRAERRFRFKRKGLDAQAIDCKPTIIDARHEASPRLSWMDCNGRIHREDSRSAEEVIRAWKRSHRAGE